MGLTPESSLTEQIHKSGVVAVIVIDDVEKAVPLAKALTDGGVNVMELTLRTPIALEALTAIREEVPEMVAGVGTVLTRGQVEAIVETEAHFAVSPGVNADIVRYATGLGLPFAPGIMTPTDIDQALGLGCHLMKYFPASTAGGLKHLKNIAAPYLHLGVGFVPLGGVSEANLQEYLESELVTAVGGSWLAPRDLVTAGDWSEIEKRAASARSLVAEVRS